MNFWFYFETCFSRRDVETVFEGRPRVLFESSGGNHAWSSYGSGKKRLDSRLDAMAFLARVVCIYISL